MQAVQYENAIDAILKRDPRFHPQAYIFLKEALDHTLKVTSEKDAGKLRHVTGPELLIGFRDYALAQFGPMAYTLLTEWGITQCQHIGEMVFLLIDEHIFGKQESDTQEDFSEIYSFEAAFTTPYLPRNLAISPALTELPSH